MRLTITIDGNGGATVTGALFQNDPAGEILFTGIDLSAYTLKCSGIVRAVYPGATTDAFTEVTAEASGTDALATIDLTGLDDLMTADGLRVAERVVIERGISLERALNYIGDLERRIRRLEDRLDETAID